MSSRSAGLAAPPAAQPEFKAGTAVSVLTAQPIGRPLDYLAPEGGCGTGDYVKVPLGPREVVGVVWGTPEGDCEAARLRPVLRRFPVPPMTIAMREFLERAAAYTLTPLPAVLRMALRVSEPGREGRPQLLYHATGKAPDRMTPARVRVLEALSDYAGAGLSMTALCREAGVSGGVVKGLEAQGALAASAAPRDAAYPPLDPARPGLALTADQARAAAALRDAVAAGRYVTTLLKGVTGSGKTEVYLEAVAACLAAGRQALVLLPEIALTEAFLARVEARFGARPAEWHSGITDAARRRCWHRVADGGARLVVGARSALFLGFSELGLIVVDEEHESAYKQEEGALYNARDMAVLRGAVADAPVVLASATPSLESWVNAKSGKYARLDLGQRVGAARMPQMQAIDMRTEALPRDRWISPRLADAVRERLEAGEQALLFINRRGYAPVTLCRACGRQIGCRHCDARMVEHRFRQKLICHQCGDSQPLPKACPACGAEDRMAALGPGIERVAEEAAALFPDTRLALLSSDRFGSASALKAEIAAIAEGAADLVVGTQLVAKGHHFPRLTLVGVVDADLSLQGSDMRAGERTFQLLRQVAGRAGRADRPGLALLQSYQPAHPVIRAILSGDEEAFWQAEANERQALGMPPFGRMAGIILSATDFARVEAAGRSLALAAAPLRAAGADVFGPAPAPIARIRGRFRVRLLVKAPKSAPLQEALQAWVAAVKIPSDVRLTIDIDPQSFL